MAIFLKNIKFGKGFLAALLAVFALAAYVNTIPNQMFWDDNDFILNNRYIKNSGHIPEMFSQNVIAGSGLHSNYWRPVLLLVFSAEWHAWQDWAPGYHLVNMLFHAANGLLLYLVLLAVFKKKYLAFFTALVFLIHPVQTEAVSYANSLGDSLSVFFMFSGLYLFIRASAASRPFYTRWQYYVALVLYCLALLSKETAIIMPALLALGWWFKDNPSAPQRAIESPKESEFTSGAASMTRGIDLDQKCMPGGGSDTLVLSGKTEGVLKLLEILGLFLVIALVYLLLRATVLNFGGTFNLYGEDNFFTSNITVRIFTFFRIFIVYAGLILWPSGLHMERSVEWAAGFFAADVILGAVLFAVLLAVMVWQLPKRNGISFGILWFLIALAPTSNILVPINGLMYEHWLYVPLAGAGTAVFWLAGSARSFFANKRVMAAGALLLFLALAALFVRTIKRNVDWNDPVVFYEDTLRYAPGSYRLLNNLAMEYAERGKNAQAEKYYLQAIKAEPKSAVAYYNLGNLYLAQNQAVSARREYENSLRADPEFLYVYPKLIQMYANEGMREEAEAVYAQYLRYVEANSR